MPSVLRTRLLRTPTFRLTLLWTLLFALSSGVLLGFFYVSTARFEEQRVSDAIRADLAGLVEQYRQNGLEGLRDVVARRAAARPDRATILLLQSPAGVRLAGNLDRWPEVLPDRRGWLEFEIDTFLDQAEDRHRALARGFLLPDGAQLLVGRDVEPVMRFRDNALRAVTWGLALTLLLGLGSGIVVSRGFAKRVEAINRTTEQIMAGDLSRRIRRVGEGDEFDRLAANLNAMLDRIERLLDARKQVTDDIAHDLRTPLTRLRNRVELALIERPDGPAVRALLEETLTEADGLIATFNALLDIAQAERGGETAGVELSALAFEGCDLYRPVAEERGLELEAEIEPGLVVEGNAHRIAQALANLLDNAVKYAARRVRVEATAASDAVVLSIADDGPGIPAEERERVLDRFVRLERDRSHPGNGLGLSLVRAVAASHQATLELADAAPGLRVVLAFSPSRRVSEAAMPVVESGEAPRLGRAAAAT